MLVGCVWAVKKCAPSAQLSSMESLSSVLGRGREERGNLQLADAKSVPSFTCVFVNAAITQSLSFCRSWLRVALHGGLLEGSLALPFFNNF